MSGYITYMRAILENKILLEFGGNHEGLVWSDPNLGRFSEVYNKI